MKTIHKSKNQYVFDNKVLQFIELDVKICRQQCPHNNHNGALPFLSLSFFSLCVFLRLFFHCCYLYSLLPLYKYLFKLVRETVLFVLKHAVHTFFVINLQKKKKGFFTWVLHINCCACCVIWTCVFCSVTLKILPAKLAAVSVTISHFNINLLIYKYIQAVTIH
jgi:hypothetical protein